MIEEAKYSKKLERLRQMKKKQDEDKTLSETYLGKLVALDNGMKKIKQDSLCILKVSELVGCLSNYVCTKN